ncbi:MAG TPA: aminodeoxychorismate synthase component I, partial [Saprospiraceae bacterium]|nr:aminodeoxychorismate synthase component I [Saprospiraceae bacterium]
MKLISDWEDKLNYLGAVQKPFGFIIDFKANNAVVVEDCVIQNDLLFDINGVTNVNICSESFDVSYTFQKEPIELSIYKDLFDQVYESILYGNTFLINLTTATPISTNLSLMNIFNRSRAKYKILVKDNFVCFSPETFVKIKANIISSFPMKGTIDATIPNAKMLILNDNKEQSEHYTIVDLLRNDLSMVAKNVRLHHFRYLEKVITNQKSLLQVSSEIRGNMDYNWHEKIGTILRKLLPAGSISGAPKNKTLEIIETVELSPRGWYTGICGYYDGVSLDTGVMIRYIEQIGDRLYFRSGGGITSQSHFKSEYK